ncbi:hypothetical protein ABKV19_003355 [Rosa sericea]
MKNLYTSVENIDVQQFHNEVCRDKLLSPRNAAESHCKDLKLKIDIGESTQYFLCPNLNCLGVSEDKLLLPWIESFTFPFHPPLLINKGIFVKGLARLIVTDDLQVLPPLSGTRLPFFTKLGVMDGDITEETFNIGVSEVLNLLICSFVSKTPLTEILLKHKPEPNFSTEIVDQGTCIEPQMAGETVIAEEEEISVKPMVSTPRKAWEYFVNLPFSFLTPPHGFTSKQKQGSSSKELIVEEEKISVKLMVSKSRKMVCFAEAGEDFVNLLFSFLTLPLGFILKNAGFFLERMY